MGVIPCRVFHLIWWTNRCRRSKNTLLATLQYVYFKNPRRRWQEINSEIEVIIFKRRRGYVYVKVDKQEGSSSFEKYTTCYAEICILIKSL